MLAEVLELADRHDSGSCVCTYVRVQVPSSARENGVESFDWLSTFLCVGIRQLCRWLDIEQIKNPCFV